LFRSDSSKFLKMRVLFLPATLVFFSLIPSVISGISAFDVAVVPSPSPTPQTSGGKRNERPTGEAKPVEPERPQPDARRFKYIFSQPHFVYRRMEIEHDSTGKGRFSFDKMNSSETITEDIVVSQRVMDSIQDAVVALDFLGSDEDYQHKRDYSHLGTVEISVSEGVLTRTATFSWTENIHARSLMENYRRLAQQYIWVFDIKVSRDNQPLDSPKLMGALENLLRRNDIADPVQILPLLDELSVDERLPLIARNQARSISQSIRAK